MSAFIDSRYFALPLYARVLIGAAVLLVIVIFAWRTKQLKVSGLIAAALTGGISIAFGGFSALFIYLFFFLSAAVISRLSKRIRGVEKIQKKGSCRDCWQVLANGAPALFALTAYHFSGEVLFLSVFAACIAEAASDTWAGDIGVLSDSLPVSILTGRQVPRGLSGGVTLLGTAAALLAAVLVAMLSYASFSLSLPLTCAAAAAGFAGCLIDSFLGASVQAHYEAEDGFLTEKRISDSGRERRLARGIRWMNNDMVNFLSNLTSFIFCWGLGSILV